MNPSRDKSTFFSNTALLRCGDNVISPESPVVMGILNLTTDSFYDGGAYLNEDEYLSRVEKMLEEGAAIIDIGAISSRPGALPVSTDDELQRLLPALRSIIRHFPDCIYSVDTYRSEVAKAAADIGAGMINDISGGQLDPKMYSTVAPYGIPYVLMHMQGTPETMQVNPSYIDPVKEIKEFFKQRISSCIDAGLKQVIIDPGFGFGKSIQHNYTLLQHLGEFLELGFPILAGVSRKSMLYKLLSVSTQDSLHATVAANTLALLQGASILRVHDVKEAVQAIRIVQAHLHPTEITAM